MVNYKDILKMAVQNEIEAYGFYKDAACKIKDPALKDTFEELSGEEQKHKLLLEGYLANYGQQMKFKPEADYKVAESVEAQPLTTDMAFKDAIAIAMKKEQEAMDMYRRFAEDSETAEQKHTFMELAKMEQGHKVRLEEIYVNAAFVEVW
ncbi:MAG: ferritin family protein [Eubacteriales bacterium]|nr:ferritin family protein [Synergistaceae bacterium]MDD3537901.1 ferritin family protein [Eubacteriales bacterium]MDD4022368.1 ferritin family protein [Synergistaceae bacterium]MDD4613676.1 ferritin family protein [Synergistaceae bacterium]